MADSTVSSTSSTRGDDSKEIKKCISETLRVVHDSREGVARFLNRESVTSKDQVQEMLNIMRQMNVLAQQLDRLNSKILIPSSTDESGSEPEYF